MAKKRTQNQEPYGRKILLLRDGAKSKMSKENIILALNEAI